MDPVNIRYLLGVLRRQWWVLVQAMLIVAGVAAWATSRIPDKPFETGATILITGAASENDTQLYINNPGVYFSIQVRVLLSDAVAQRAAARLSPPMSAADARAAVTGTYDADVGTLRVTARGEDPDQIIDIANAFVDAYVEYVSDNQSDSLQARVEQLESELEQSDQDITDLTNQMIDEVFNEGNTDIKALEARQTALIQRNTALYTAREDVLTEIASQPTLAQGLEPSVSAGRPPKPSITLRTSIGALVGLMVGAALAALREALDDRLRSVEQVSRISNVATLVEIPKAGGKIDSKLSVFEEPERGFSESLRSLRTSIRFLDVGEPIHSVAVTSPAPGDGKSVTAANLATAFAMAGTKTIIVSGDMRRPTMDTRFGVSGQSGFSDILLAAHQSAAPEDAVASISAVAAEYYLVETQVPNLRVLPSGTPVPNPAELLGSRHLREVVTELCSLADMVVIDCPPTVVTDGVLLARLTDGCVLVTSLNKSRKSALKLAVERLHNARVNLLGMAINRSGPERRSSYSYYRPQVSSAQLGGIAPSAKPPKSKAK